MTPAARTSFAIGTLLTLALLSSSLALLAGFRTYRYLTAVVEENLPSLRSSAELEQALLEQRGFASAYLIDQGGGEWLQELERRKPRFDHALAQARRAARTEVERRILVRLEAVYREYDARRDQVIELQRRGRGREAREALLGDVMALAGDAHVLCQQLGEANERFILASTNGASRDIRTMTLAVTAVVALTIGLGIALLFTLLRGLLWPLGRLAAEARGLEGSPAQAGALKPEAQLGAINRVLKTLTQDVKQAQESLEDARAQILKHDRMAALGRLSASVAHEIRNPLGSIRLWLYSLRRGVAEDSEVAARCLMLEGEVVRLERIVQNFLQVGRTPSGEFRSQHVRRLMDKTLELVGPSIREKRLCLVRSDPLPLPAVLADPEQLEQVFLNLLNNAADATPAGGVVRVDERAEIGGDGRATVVVRISDSGPGLADSVRPRLFEPFVTTKEEGAGLGLYTSAGIVGQHGGQLVLEEATALGCTFAVRLPADEGTRA